MEPVVDFVTSHRDTQITREIQKRGNIQAELPCAGAPRDRPGAHGIENQQAPRTLRSIRPGNGRGYLDGDDDANSLHAAASLHTSASPATHHPRGPQRRSAPTVRRGVDALLRMIARPPAQWLETR